MEYAKWDTFRSLLDLLCILLDVFLLLLGAIWLLFVVIVCVQSFFDHVRPVFSPPFGVGASLRAGPSPVGQVSKA